jgi:hypothetical protein
MVYRVFTVFLRPQTVHNLFKLCYLEAGRLFRNHATGDAVSRISRRIALQIIGLGMNY